MVFSTRFHVLAVAGIFSFLFSNAQDSSSSKKMLFVKADLVRPVITVVYNSENFVGGSASLELGFNKRKSIQLMGTRMSQLNLLVPYESLTDYHYTEIVAAYKNYLFKRANYSGLFVAPYINAQILNAEHLFFRGNDKYLKRNTVELGGGGMVGYQLRWKRFVFELLVGAGATKLVYMKEESDFFIDPMSPDIQYLKKTHSNLQFGLCIGFNMWNSKP